MAAETSSLFNTSRATFVCHGKREKRQKKTHIWYLKESKPNQVYSK